MPINSRAKGAAGERELAHWLEERGLQARRGQQFNGLEGKDVVCDELPIHIECKRVETLQLYKALEQAERDAKDETAVVFHRRNRKKWVAILDADELIKLYQRLKYQNEDNFSID